MQMNAQTLEVDQFKYLGSTQTKDGTSVKEIKIRLAQANSAMTRLAMLRKNKVINFPTQTIYSVGHLSCRCFFMDVTAGR